MNDPHIERRIAPVLTKDYDVISSDELRTCGVSCHVQKRMTASGRFTQMARRVVCGARTLTRETWWMAAQKTLAGLGCLTHATAGAIWGVDRIGINAKVPGDGVHVTMPTRRSPASWITSHHSPSIVHDRWQTIHRFVVTSLARTVVDLGELRTVEQLTNILHEASIVDRRIFSKVAAELDRRPNLAQRLTVLDALSLARAGDHGTINEFEDLWARIVREEGIDGARFGFPIKTRALDWVVVDSAWPESLVIVELDGGVHRAIRKRKRDRRVEKALEELGWKIVRVRWRDLHEGRADTVARVRRLIDARLVQAPVSK